MNKIIFWSWSSLNKEKAERTERKKFNQIEENNMDMTNSKINNPIDGFNSFENMDEITFNTINNTFVKKDNKREESNERLLGRGMLIQKSVNPFLMKNSYVDDMDVQSRFLTPKDSNINNEKSI